MSMIGFLLIFGGMGVLLFIIALGLLFLYKDGLAIVMAKLTKSAVVFKIDPNTRHIKLQRIPDKDLVEKKEDLLFLGNWPNYRLGGVKAFFVFEGEAIDFDPAIMAEVQKAMREGYDTFEALKKSVVQKVRRQIVQPAPEGGQTVVKEIEEVVLKPLIGRNHRVIDIRPIGNDGKKGARFIIEEYTPVEFIPITNFYGRKFSVDAIMRLLKLRDSIWLEKMRLIYNKFIKGVNVKKTSGSGFNPLWLIYLGVFVFIVLLALSLYGGNVLGGGANPLPPSP